jgi:hypothetical protein
MADTIKSPLCLFITKNADEIFISKACISGKGHAYV